ncbi:hypothetical protein Ppa06_27140 [Planomonospora parontospora subsp. parontospora]|uniref:Uncharacterized protein n=2 Tax=Planomonospora parontospora TaxID=58119 RepID=A0AA37BH17_9ACTN|nr:hypothetical protein [Planomonospora parontospora]GGK69364.1 hypothetical protein GCM10010126_31040 [Planomonospora parontospora]GII08916.1 hypothetical protein Ppa06_27140 [Planomonospora parontospora subsp. parontospora]
MKINLMSVQLGLTSACPGTTLPVFGGQAILADAAVVPMRRDKSVIFQVQVSREAALFAIPATGVPAAPAAEAGDYAQQTEHTGNGGLRGPQPWRHPQVI